VSLVLEKLDLEIESTATAGVTLIGTVKNKTPLSLFPPTTYNRTEQEAC